MARLLVVNQFAIPPYKSGGTRHHALGKYLVARGHDVTLMASGGVGGEIGGPLPSEQVIEGVRYVFDAQPPLGRSLPSRLRSMLRFSSFVLRKGRALTPRPDLVFGSSPSLFGAFASALLSRWLGVPFVLEVRDLWPLSLVYILGVSPRHPIVWVMGRMERWLYRYADAIVTPLDNAQEHMERVAGKALNVHVATNGVDVALMGHSAPIPPVEGVLEVLYAGAHGPANALDVYVDAARMLYEQGDTSIRFRFVGDGSAKPELVERSRGIPTIRFDPPVAKENMPAVLASAHVFVINIPDHPLYAYGFSPNKLYDYLFAGRPVVIGTGLAKQVVSLSGGGVTIPPNDPAALVAALKGLSSLPAEELSAMGQRGRAYVEAHCDWSVLANRLATVLEPLVAA